MGNIMLALCLVLGLGVIVIIMGWNLYDWANRYINEEELDHRGKPERWGWLHLKAEEYLGLESSPYPTPVPMIYFSAILLVTLGSILWFIALPAMMIMGVLTYLRYEKRKEKLTS